MGLDIYFRKAPKALETPSYNNTTEAGYFRKFNALHAWFVREVQNGKDDCGFYPVEKETLEKFLQVINSLTPENCEKVLPTQDGFFFGNTGYGEMYWSDVQDAKEHISRILEETDFENELIFYHSSW